MNASGIKCTTNDELFELMINKYTKYVITTSCTFNSFNNPRKYHYNATEKTSIISNISDNFGFDYYANFYITYLDLMEIESFELTDKPFFISIYVSHIQDLVKLQKNILDYADIVVNKFGKNRVMFELNLSCLNTGINSIVYDSIKFKELLDYISETFNTNYIKFGIKLPMLYTELQFNYVANICSNYDIEYLATINGIHGTIITDEIVTGVLGGKMLKPIGLENVRQLSARLNGKIPIIGAGGVFSGKDVREYMLCGASAVQIGTCFYTEGIECFERIAKEFYTLKKV
jgi:dihydroorotate dehydrogenase (fumarate)